MKELLELNEVEVLEFNSEEYINDSGNHHISSCFQCPECGYIKFWALERYNTTLCVDCANILDDMEESLSIFDELL